MDITTQDEMPYTIHYQASFLCNVENEYCMIHQPMSVIKPANVQHSHFFPSAKTSEFAESWFVAYHSSSDDDEFWMPKCVSQLSPGQCNRATPRLTVARLYLNSAPESPKNWGQVNPNVNEYHSHSMKISSTFWFPDIARWWHQQEDMHWQYADPSNVARKIFSIISHIVAMEASYYFERDTIGRGQSKTTVEMLLYKVVVR